MNPAKEKRILDQLYAERRKALSIIGKVGLERGHRLEQRIVEAFQNIQGKSEKPDWFQGIRLSNPNQDRKGIDVIVESDVGDLYLQIKSCSNGKIKFFKQRGHFRHKKPIAVVVAQYHESDEELRQRVVLAATELRETFLQKRQHLF